MQGGYQGLETALRALGAFVLAALRGELEAARSRFLAPSPAGEAHQEGAEARFLEWFCMEQRLASGQLVYERFLDAGCPGLDLEGEIHAVLFGSSRSGIFQVLARWEPDGFRVLDSVLGEECRLCWPPDLSAHPVLSGSLLGRLYRVPGEGPIAFFPSPALVLYQEADLGRAVRADAARARGLGHIPALGQLELERLLRGELPLTPEPLGPTLGLADLEERIQLLFERHGFAGLSAQELTRQAASGASFDAIFRELLDELAFDTDADLDELKRLFLQLWTAAREPGREPRRHPARPGSWPDPDEPCPCGSGVPYLECHLGSDLVSRLREAEARGEKRAPIFEGLGFLLDEEESEGTITPFEEGLTEVEGLVREYLWERSLPGSGPEAAMLDAYLEHLKQREPSLPPLRAEDLVGPPLIAWLLHRFLAQTPEEAAAFLEQARALWLPLASWLEREHGLFPLRSGPAERIGLHLDGFQRALQARLELSGGEVVPGPGAVPRAGIFQVVEQEGRLCLAAWPTDGDPPRRIDPAGAAHLKAGDLLWGRPWPTERGLVFQGNVAVGPVESLAFLEERAAEPE